MTDLLVGQADLTNDTAGIADVEDGDRMAVAAGAFEAAGTMADGALERGAAEDLAGLGEAGQETVATLNDPLSIHYQ